jgi:hypothetical protein
MRLLWILMTPILLLLFLCFGSIIFLMAIMFFRFNTPEPDNWDRLLAEETHE